MVFVLTQENASSQKVYFKAYRKTLGSSKKMVPGIFKIALSLKNRDVFMWRSLENLKIFNALILLQVFWKTKNFFKELERSFLIKITTIESVPFSY